MSTMEQAASFGRIAVFGEVLFDVFPGGKRVLGGAPFNVAWHLRGFGLSPLMITRVGDDEDGREVLQAMERWGMDTAGVQIDAEHPTGTVQVTLSGGQPEFHIVPEQAYDFIDADQAGAVSGGIGVLYHGSLASRNRESAAALRSLLRPGVPVFLDVNLREPWWSVDNVRTLISSARWIKLNAEELAAVSGDSENAAGTAEGILHDRGAEFLIVTKGEQGAVIRDRAGGYFEVRPEPFGEVADTVGAGDAFSAVCLYGLLNGWEVPVMLRRAAGFAARICAIDGATTFDTNLYRDALSAWKGE